MISARGGQAKATKESESDGATLRPRAEPMYRRIFLALEKKIYEGVFPGGSYLPSEAELANEFDVSRITSMRALNDLADAGLVIREQGRGTRVRHAASAKIVRGPASAARTDDGETVVRLPQAPREERFTIVDFGAVAAPGDIARAFGIKAGTAVHRSTRLLQFAGKPYAHVVVYLRPGVGDSLRPQDLKKSSLHALLRSDGVVIDRNDEEIDAVAADRVTAKLLKVPVRDPLLRVTRIGFDADGRAVEHMTALHAQGRYRYAVSTRGAAGA